MQCAWRPARTSIRIYATWLRHKGHVALRAKQPCAQAQHNLCWHACVHFAPVRLHIVATLVRSSSDLQTAHSSASCALCCHARFFAGRPRALRDLGAAMALCSALHCSVKSHSFMTAAAVPSPPAFSILQLEIRKTWRGAKFYFKVFSTRVSKCMSSNNFHI